MPKLTRFILRIEDCELRTCDKSLLSMGEHVTMEIVKVEQNSTGNETTFTLAHWKEGSCGFDLKFVGSRPFRECKKELFWELAKAGQEHLDDFFDECQ